MRLKLLLLAASPLLMFAQPATVTLPQPDCQIVINLTAVNQTTPTAPNAGYNNLAGGCTTWAMSIAVSGFSAATVALQSAPNVAGVPGTWVTFVGTPFSPSPHNVNPIVTATQGFVWEYGYNPWVRVALTAATGTGAVNGLAYGWRIPSATSNGAGEAGTNVNIAEFGGVAVALGQALSSGSIPVVLASDQSALSVSSLCDNPASIVNSFTALSSSGAQQLVAGVSGKKIYVCKRYVTTATGENLTWTSATAGSCGGTTATIDQQLSVLAVALDDNGSFVVGTGLNLCLNPSASQAATVFVAYVQF